MLRQSLALAQPPGTTRSSSSTTTTASFHRITTVVGTAFSLGNENIGKVVDVVYDDGGCIEYVLVQDPDGFVVVPWGVVTVNYDQKVVTVNSTTVTRDKLREVTFTEGRLPNFSDGVIHPEDDDRLGRSGPPIRGAGRTGTGTGTPGSGTTTPDRKGGTPPDRTTPPDRKGGTTTPPDRTNPGTTTPPQKPGTTTPPGKGEPPAKETPKTPPKKDKDKDGK